MSILLAFGACIVAALLLVAVEVACAVLQVEVRPSYLLRLVARNTGWLFGLVGEFLAKIADVFSAFRRLVLFLHELFFRWIPVELVRQALRDLSTAIRDLLTAPMELFYGVGRGLMAATLPLVATTTFLVGSILSLVIWETTTMIMGWGFLRPSTFLATGVIGLRSAAYGTGFFFMSMVTDTWGWIARVVSRIINIPFPLVKKALDALFHSTQNITSVPEDFRHGIRDVAPTWVDSIHVSWAAQVVMVLIVVWVISKSLVYIVSLIFGGASAVPGGGDRGAEEQDDAPADAEARPRRRTVGTHA